MGVNRGPTDQDEKPTLRCSVCHQLRPCYRGPVRSTVQVGDVTFENVAWFCADCLKAKVDEGIRRAQ